MSYAIRAERSTTSASVAAVLVESLENRQFLSVSIADPSTLGDSGQAVSTLMMPRSVEDVASTHQFATTGRNPFFVLEIGKKLVLEGTTGSQRIRSVLTVTKMTKTIDGVQTRVVLDKETHNGKLAEVSRNFFAIDKNTKDLFYFGENVDTIVNGKVVNHDGTSG